MENNGDKLIERILLDAEAEAESVRKAGFAEAESILKKGKEEIALMRRENELACGKAAREIEERSRIKGGLEARKFALSEKRKVVREAFDAAQKALCELKGGERETLLKSLLEKEAEGGESVLPSAVDRPALQKLLPGLNEKLRAAGRQPLVLETKDHPCSGGFMLVSGIYEKNCSFVALMQELQAKEESKIAEMLF
jgi:vacuolar-type H+-ATPase subunit E/Vma4